MTKFEYEVHPKFRVITDNDYAGDPDGLIQLAHLLLSKTADVKAVVSSHLLTDVPWPVPQLPSDAGAKLAQRVADYCGYQGKILAGAETGMTAIDAPTQSAAVDFLIQEALDESSGLPLYVLCGGSLTTIASAYLKEPSIASKLKLVLIGGPGYEETADSEPEFNFSADLFAAQVIFNQSDIELVQVPRTTYAQTKASRIEMVNRMANVNELGAFIWDCYLDIEKFAYSIGINFGEVFVLGDSPLVLISCLQTALGGDGESVCKRQPSFALDSRGHYDRSKPGREITVYHTIDNRLMMEDFFLKLANLAT
jgi:hypothetical protein